MATKSAQPSTEWLSLEPEAQRVIEHHQIKMPVEVGAIARSFGLEVKVATLEIGISGEISPAGKTYRIRINKHEVKQRQRFTLAHEISHFLLHRHLIKDGIFDNVLFRSKLSNTEEAQANRLAADILMPMSVVMMRFKEMKESGHKRTDCVVPLADIFQVSEDAMAIRLGVK